MKIIHDREYWLTRFGHSVLVQDTYKFLGEICFTEWQDRDTAIRMASHKTVAIWKIKLKEPKQQPVKVDSLFFSLN